MSNKDNLKKSVLNALSTVQDPDLHKDLVTLNMIKDLKIVGEKASFRIVLTTPACPMKDRIKNDAIDAVKKVPGVKEVEVTMDAEVPADGKVRGLLDAPVKNAVAIASGKGGVGKSTIAVNLAVSLAKSGASVGLMDADIYGPNIPTMMGVNKIPGTDGKKLIPAEAYGVKMISIGFLVKPGEPLIWRGPMLHSAIRQFITDVSWGELDYLIIDLPPGTGDAQLSLCQSLALSGGIIVTLPQQVSLEDARRGLEMFRKLNVPVLGVIENMSYLELPDGTRMDIFGFGGGERLAKDAGVPFLGAIPIDPLVRLGGDDGVPVVISNEKSVVSQELIKATQRIAAEVSIAAINKENRIPINMVGFGKK